MQTKETNEGVFAHSVDGQKKEYWETLEDHSIRVSKACEQRAQYFGSAEITDAAINLGLLHDLGKTKPAFQRRLEGDRTPVSHSSEGALILDKRHQFGQVLASAVAGHHGCLPNPDKLTRRLKEAVALDIPTWMALPELDIPKRVREPGGAPDVWFRIQFLTRMLYSCLVDADDSETAAFYNEFKGEPPQERLTTLQPEHIVKFNEFMGSFKADGSVNSLRAEVLRHDRSASA